jgi:hypothetical protein
MRDVLMIGAKEVAMVANAATAHLYKQTFHEDLLTSISKFSADASDDVLTAVDKIQKLAFIMSQQAEKSFAELYGKLTEKDFLMWLCGFEESDFQTPEVLIGVLGVWNKNLKSKSEAKNP